jgi:hypothetical protein
MALEMKEKIIGSIPSEGVLPPFGQVNILNKEKMKFFKNNCTKNFF